MGVKETQQEDTLKVVKKFIQDKAGFQINERDVIATHRIPGETGKPRPIIVKDQGHEKAVRNKANGKRSSTGGRRNKCKLGDNIPASWKGRHRVRMVLQRLCIRESQRKGAQD